jgi:hypothetical protein
MQNRDTKNVEDLKMGLIDFAAVLCIVIIGGLRANGEVCDSLFKPGAIDRVAVGFAKWPQQQLANDFTTFSMSLPEDKADIFTECSMAKKPPKMMLRFRVKGTSHGWNKTTINAQTTELQEGIGILPCTSYQIQLKAKKGKVSDLLKLSNVWSGPRSVSVESVKNKGEGTKLRWEIPDDSSCYESVNLVVNGRTLTVEKGTNEADLENEPCVDTTVALSLKFAGLNGLSSSRTFYRMPANVDMDASAVKGVIAWKPQRLRERCPKIHSAKFDVRVRNQLDTDESVIVDSQMLSFVDMNEEKRLLAEDIAEEMTKESLMGPCMKYFLDMNATVFGEGAQQVEFKMLESISMVTDKDNNVVFADELPNGCATNPRSRTAKATIFNTEEDQLTELEVKLKGLGDLGPGQDTTTLTNEEILVVTPINASDMFPHEDEDEETNPRHAQSSLNVAEETDKTATSGLGMTGTVLIAVITVLVMVGLAGFFIAATKKIRKNNDVEVSPEWDKKQAHHPLTLRNGDAAVDLSQFNDIVQLSNQNEGDTRQL